MPEDKYIADAEKAELDGLVYGMAVVDEHVPAPERVWYRKPGTLAIGALGLTAILSFIFA